MPFLFLLALQSAQPPATPAPRQTAPDQPTEEVIVRSPSRALPQTPATMLVEPVAMMIAGLDADGDGVTTRSEMEGGVARSFAAVAAGGADTGLRYLAFADWALRYLGDRNALPSPFDVDRDGDGRITPDELQSQFSRLYSRFNANGDEGISRAELLTFRTGPIDKDGPARAGRKPDRPATPRKPR